MINKTIKTICEQINSNELRFFGFVLIVNNEENSLTLKKGFKYLTIKYIEGKDLYNIRQFETIKFRLIEINKLDGVYCDQLSDIIEDYFKFCYLHKVQFG